MSDLLFNVAALCGKFLTIFAAYSVIEGYVSSVDRPHLNRTAKSLLFALVGLYTLYSPITLTEGVIADPRGAMVACATLFGGRGAGLTTTLAMIAYRLWLGGSGAVAGAVGLAVEYLVILAMIQAPLVRFLPRQSYRSLLAASLAVAVLEPLSLLLIPPSALGLELFTQAGPALGLLQLLSTLLLGALLKIEDDRTRLLRDLRARDLVFANAQEGVMITDAGGRIAAVNPALTDITGYPARDVLGQSFEILGCDRQAPAFYRGIWTAMDATGAWRGEVWNRRRNGQVYPVWLTLSAVRGHGGRLTQSVGVFTDITLMKNYQAQLEFLAHHDALTGLPNRLLLCARLDQALRGAAREGAMLGVLFIDLDRFKRINDSLGHAAGDALLQAAAQRLQTAIRDGDCIARLGGDEFVVLAEHLHSREEAALLARRLIATLTAPITLAAHELYLSASIGVSLYPRDGDSVEPLLQNADAAMYRAKEQGRNTYQFYCEEMTAIAHERIMLEGQLRKALVQGQLLLHYQPQIELRTGRITAVEALARWPHPDHGMIPPTRFIPVAEDTGLIRELGAWVLREACRQARAWLDAGCTIERMAVNVSGVQLQHGDFLTQVEQALAETGLPARHLELEITETIMMKADLDIIVLLNTLRTRGLMISIDDFGTGYSSLARLKRLPADKLKIDRSFVQHLPDDENDAAIARSIIALGANMGYTVLAEGVETAAQRDFLLAQGCAQAQGYWFGRPVPAEELTPLLRAH